MHTGVLVGVCSDPLQRLFQHNRAFQETTYHLPNSSASSENHLLFVGGKVMVASRRALVVISLLQQCNVFFT